MKLTGNPVLGADLSESALTFFETPGGKRSSLQQIIHERDAVVATAGAAGLIEPEMFRKGQIILTIYIRIPKIAPVSANQTGAAFAADGKSENNVLGFPGILRGVVDSFASSITCEMYLAAALLSPIKLLRTSLYLIPR